MKSIRGPLALFLVAYFLYTDALTTVIDFTGIYTKEVLAFTPKDTITLFLILNVIAAPGALLFGVLADRWGGKPALQLSLVIWLAVVVGAIAASTKQAFWPVAILAALVIGSTQAGSRALMAQMAPAGRSAEFMGFLALSGKASAVLGPAVYGVIADAAASPSHPGQGQRIAIGVIGSLFVVAWFVLSRLPAQPKPVD